MNKKHLLLLVSFLVLLMPLQVLADQIPVAIIDDDAKTMTFKYADASTVNNADVFSIYDYKTVNGKKYNRWIKDDETTYIGNVHKIIFEPSFSNARPKSTRAWFTNCTKIDSIVGIENLNTSEVTDMAYMFYLTFHTHNRISTVDVSGFNTANVEDMSYMFYYGDELQDLDVSRWNTSKVKNMSHLFYWCYDLTFLDVSNWNTSNVIDMGSTFEGCCYLKTLDVSNWITTNVTNMKNLFDGCWHVDFLDVSNFQTDKVTDMSGMFSSYWGTTLDVSNFNTANVTDMNSMFSNCQYLMEIDISKFNTAKVKDMRSMFRQDSTLTHLDFSNFNTANVTDMSEMFYKCTNLASLDLSNFNTANVKDMSNMFYDCSSLTSLDVSNFNTAKVESMELMFYNCSSLTSLDVSSFVLNAPATYYKDFWMSFWMYKCSNLQVLNIGGNSTIGCPKRLTNYDNYDYGKYAYGPAFREIGTERKPCKLVINEKFDKSVLGEKQENPSDGYYFWLNGYFSEPTTDDITTIKVLDNQNADAPAYNLAGQRVGNDYKGVVIMNGKKMIRK